MPQSDLYAQILQRSEQLRAKNLQNPDPRFAEMISELQSQVIAKQ